MDMDIDPDENQVTEQAYEYPDPELAQRSLYGNWLVEGAASRFGERNRRFADVSSDLKATSLIAEDDALQSLDSELLALAGDDSEIDPEYDGVNASDQSDEVASEAKSIEVVDVTQDSPARPRGRGSGRPRGRPRGSGRGRGQGRGGARGRGGSGQQTGKAVDDPDDSDNPRKRKRSNAANKPGRKRGGKRGFRKPIPPADDFSDLMSQATIAYVANDYAQAMEIVGKAISLNPDMFGAHSLLSEILFAQGDLERSTAALFHGAHVMQRDVKVWEQSAVFILRRAGDLRPPKMLGDAIYCYSKILGLKPEKIDIRRERAALYREIGANGKALRDYRLIYSSSEHDIDILRSLAELEVTLSGPSGAIPVYDELISLLQDSQPERPTDFAWGDLSAYAELLITTKDPETALVKLKRGARWLLGRLKDNSWDNHTSDDREFDTDHGSRRSQIIPSSEEAFPIESFGKGLPLQIRAQLGRLRLQLQGDHTAEALFHFEHLLPVPSESDADSDHPIDLYRNVADALGTHGLLTEALEFYEPLRTLEESWDPSFYAQLASCYRQLGMLEKAEDCYRALISYDDNDLKSRREMVQMFHSADQDDRAAPYLRQLAERKKRQHRPLLGLDNHNDRLAFMDPKGDPDIPMDSIEPEDGESAGHKPSKRTRWRRTKDEENQENLQPAFEAMMNLKRRVEAGDTEARAHWMRSARPLIRQFRETAVFFPYEPYVKFYGYGAEAKARSLRPKAKQQELDQELAEMLNIPIDQLPAEHVPDKFCHVTFDKWLDVFLVYAILLAEDGNTRESYAVLDVAVACNVFYLSKEFMFRIYVVWAICALHADDAEKLTTVARFFMTAYQFVSHSYQLYAALHRLCGKPNLFYNSSIIQKFIMRQIKAIDYCVVENIPDNEEGAAEWKEQYSARHSVFEERAGFYTTDANGDPIKPIGFDVPILFLYGQILYAGGNYAYALNYFYRAHAMDSENPLINLSIALAYIHHAFKRQALNRHTLIMQGLSFLFTYHDRRIRGEVLVEKQEACYNVGRVFHLLGLMHLAIPRYEKALAIGEEIRERVQKEDEERQSSLHGPTQAHETSHVPYREDFSIDAAFALQGIHAIGGDMRRAQRVVNKWMVLE